MNEQPLGDLDRGIRMDKREAVKRIDQLIREGHALHKSVSDNEKTIAQVQPEVDDWRKSVTPRLNEIFTTAGAAGLFNTDYLTHNQVVFYRDSVLYRIEKLTQLRAVASQAPPASAADVWFDFRRDPRAPYQIAIWLVTVILGSGIVVFWLETCHYQK